MTGATPLSSVVPRCVAPVVGVVLFFLFFVPWRVTAAEPVPPEPTPTAQEPLPLANGTGGAPASSGASLPLRNALIIGAGTALVTAYGMTNWWEEGFGGGFKVKNEGWFGAGTEYGGADKLGHMYSNYATFRLLTSLFEAAGNGRNAALSLAMWSTIGIYTGVEIADGYSRDYDFSPQDTTMNTIGLVLGLALEMRPELDAMFDVRVDYRPSPGSNFDPFGDYSGQKYLLVTKADGFEHLRAHRFLRYVEVAVGYGTRGFDNEREHHRDAYLGLGLNLARLLADGVYEGEMHTTRFQRASERVLDMVQLPAVGYVRGSID